MPGRYSLGTITALLISGVVLTGVCVWICAGMVMEGTLDDYHHVSFLFCLVMVVVMDYELINERNRLIQQNRAKAEGKALEQVSQSSGRRLVLSAIPVVASLAVVVILLLVPNGPGRDWQFAVAAAVTSIVFFVSNLLSERKRKKEREQDG